MLTNDYKAKLLNGDFNKSLSYIYCGKDTDAYVARYVKAIESFEKQFGDGKDIEIFSAPGRSEIIGNHTDHQRGKCMGASVNLDVVGVAAKNDDRIIRIKSEGYKMDVIDLKDLNFKPDEVNTSAALIRGIANRFEDMGYTIDGFDVYTTSNVLKGSGLSSSAAFEVLVGNVINDLFCAGKEDASSIAKIGQYAENKFFGKPCGMLDQMSSSVGGFVYLDFYDLKNPKFEKIDFDFSKANHSLCIVDTGGNHADLTPEYAAVTKEMNKVAGYFGKEVLIDVDVDDFYTNISKLRASAGDRAVLRSIHFLNEVERVDACAEYLKNGDFKGFKKMLVESGHSSFMYLQNVYPASLPKEQGTSLALAMCDKILDGEGAFRIHGGGFAGTIQAFVPNKKLNDFKAKIERIFGENSCYVLSVRPVGGYKLAE